MAIQTSRNEPEVMAGYLISSSTGRRYTLQTQTGWAIPANVVQQIWASVMARRCPDEWNGLDPPDDVTVIWWADPTRLECARHFRHLGDYVAYNIGPWYGLVEDTGREYLPGPEQNWTGYQRPPGSHMHKPPTRRRFELAGNLWRAETTIGLFRCPVCPEQLSESLFELGRELFEHSRPVHRLVPAS